MVFGSDSLTGKGTAPPRASTPLVLGGLGGQAITRISCAKVVFFSGCAVSVRADKRASSSDSCTSWASEGGANPSLGVREPLQMLSYITSHAGPSRVAKAPRCHLACKRVSEPATCACPPAEDANPPGSDTKDFFLVAPQAA